jgi:hypothetical protein
MSVAGGSGRYRLCSWSNDPALTYSRQASTEHFQQRTEFPPLRNRGVGQRDEGESWSVSGTSRVVFKTRLPSYLLSVPRLAEHTTRLKLFSSLDDLEGGGLGGS